MKYFNNNDILLADFDGVLLDSQSKHNEIMGDILDFDLWMQYLNNVDWHLFLRSCDFISDALETFLTLQDLNILKGFITRIHTFAEGEEKCLLLRDYGFRVPIYYTLPLQRKNMVFMPNKNTVLVDDDPVNTSNWVSSGGKAILYNPYAECSSSKVIKKIKHLLK